MVSNRSESPEPVCLMSYYVPASKVTKYLRLKILPSGSIQVLSTFDFHQQQVKAIVPVDGIPEAFLALTTTRALLLLFDHSQDHQVCLFELDDWDLTENALLAAFANEVSIQKHAHLNRFFSSELLGTIRYQRPRYFRVFEQYS